MEGVRHNTGLLPIIFNASPRRAALQFLLLVGSIVALAIVRLRATLLSAESGACSGVETGTALRALLLCSLGHVLGSGVPCCLEFGVVFLDVGKILGIDSILELRACALDRRFLLGRDLVSVLLEVLLGLEHHRIGVVHLIDALLLRLVRFLVGLGLIPHTLDFVIRKSA